MLILIDKYLRKISLHQNFNIFKFVEVAKCLSNSLNLLESYFSLTKQHRSHVCYKDIITYTPRKTKNVKQTR